jgi:hypothetical protein
MTRPSAIQCEVLPNGALAVSQLTRYGVRQCEVLYTVLPGTSDRARKQLEEQIAIQQIARLKYEKRQAADAVTEAARMFYDRVNPKIARLRAEGLSYEKIAVRFNDAGELTRTGLPWSGSSVREAFDRTSGSS